MRLVIFFHRKSLSLSRLQAVPRSNRLRWAAPLCSAPLRCLLLSRRLSTNHVLLRFIKLIDSFID